MIWLIIGILVLASLLYITKPLYTPNPKQDPATIEVEAYKRQITELDGRIKNETGDSDTHALKIAKADLQRQILSTGTSKFEQKPPAPVFLASFFVIFGFAALGLYALLGRPELTQAGALQTPVLSADRAITQNAEPQHENNLSLKQLVERLESKLQQDPQNPDGWILYARSLMNLKNYAGAIRAYENVLALTDNNPNVAEELASAKAYIAGQTDNGRETPPTQTPATPAPAPGPTSADIQAAAALSEQDRAAMIENMVEGLSEKLKTAPNDPQKWMQLLRARKVLGQEQKAREEIERLKKIYADDPQTLAAILENSGWAPKR